MQQRRAAGARAGGWRYQLLPVAARGVRRDRRAALGARRASAARTSRSRTRRRRSRSRRARRERARAIGAANTLTFGAGGAIHADNTDAPGFIAALPQPPARGSTALVLGAGGSARAVVYALRERGVDVAGLEPHARAGRRARRATSAARRSIAARPADLLVNCTAVGLGRSVQRLRGSAADRRRPRYIRDRGGPRLSPRRHRTPRSSARRGGALSSTGWRSWCSRAR